MKNCFRHFNTVAYTNKDLDDEGNVDPTDDGWSDEYQIDDLELLAGDFIIPLYNSISHLF